ncbi:small-conductance mechanosensitive channel [Streptomyces nodosus]|nr:small-conductance mechanosensitive channel [Streptomyces nodosus]
MGDRAEEFPARAGGPRTPRGPWAAVAPLALFSLTTGVFAVVAGALAALLVPGSTARALVWLVVTIVAAVSAGLWWGLTPVTERLRVLDRAVARLRPRGSRGR